MIYSPLGTKGAECHQHGSWGIFLGCARCTQLDTDTQLDTALSRLHPFERVTRDRFLVPNVAPHPTATLLMVYGLCSSP